MASGHAQLAAHLQRLRELKTLGKRAAPEVSRALEGEMRSQIASGVGPDGTPWKLTEDGKVPLQGAMKNLRIRPVGTTVVMQLKGRHARHHLGAVKGGKIRRIIPTGAVPDPMTKAIRVVVTDEFRRTMGVG